MSVEIKATDRYIRVLRADGSLLSQHLTIEDAIERAVNAGIGSYILKYPDRTVKVLGILNPQTGDTQAPTIPGIPTLVARSATTITVSAAASTDNIGVTGYQWFLNGVPNGAPTASPSKTYSGLSPSTSYALTVTAFDAAGNVSASSQTANIATLANAAPVWNLPQQELTVGVAYNLDLLSVCSDADTNPLTFSIVSGTLPAGLTFSAALKTISGTPTTVQNPTVTLRSNDGIVNSDQAVVFNVLNADTTAPPVPTMNAAGSITQSSMALSCSTVSDTVVANARTSGSVQYVLQRATNSGFTTGVVTEAAQAGTSWSIAGLSANTTYWFRVRSQDAAGNQSAFSASVNATTLPTEQLFFDNSFEDDFASWTGSTGTTAIASSGVASDGVKYAQSVLTPGSFNDNGRYKELGTAGSVVTQFRNGFVQGDYCFGAFTGLWPESDQQKMMIAQYYDPVWASFSNSRRKFQIILGVAANALSQRGQLYFQLIEWNDTTGTFVQGANVFQNLGTVGPTPDKWDRIRVQIQLDTNGNATLGVGNGNGILRLWVNNTLVMEHLNVNLVRGNANVGCGRILPNSTAQGSTWQGTASSLNWDNIQVATAASLLDAMWSTPPDRLTSYVPNIFFARDFRGGNSPAFGFPGTHSGAGSQWLIESAAGGYGGGTCARLTFLQGVSQQDTGWFFSGGGSIWNAGSVMTFRFRIKYESTYRWLGGGSLQNKMVMVRNSGAGLRMILHCERPHDTTPGGLSAAYESPTNDGRFGGWVMKHNIAPPITSPTIARTFDGGPGVTPNPSVTYVRPDSQGWYNIQMQIMFASAGQSNGFFKMWVNNNNYSSPSAQNLATTLTGPIDQMDLGEFMSEAPSQNNTIRYNDLEIEHATAAQGAQIRFKPNWWDGTSQ